MKILAIVGILSCTLAGCWRDSGGTADQVALSQTALEPRELQKRAHALFKSAVKNFETQTGATLKNHNEGALALSEYKDLLKKARQGNLPFDKIYTKWEAVHAETIALDQSFQALVKSADEFISSTKRQANTIQNSKMRSDSLKTIEEFEHRYSKRLQFTMNDITKLHNLKSEVDDTIKVLEIKFVISEAEKDLNKILDEIDSKLKSLQESVKLLIEESKGMINL